MANDNESGGLADRLSTWTRRISKRISNRHLKMRLKLAAFPLFY